MQKLLLTILFTLACMIVKSQSADTLPDDEYIQNDSIKVKEENYIEEYSGRFEDYLDFSDFRITDIFTDQPRVNINKASNRSLQQLNLNEEQISNLRKYITEYGEVTGIYELNLIEGFDSALIVTIAPLINFKIDTEVHKISMKELQKRGVNTILARYSRNLEPSKGYIKLNENSMSPLFAGNPDKLLFRYSYRYYDRLKFGFSLEKDAGESLEKGFDFSSFYFQYSSKGLLKSFVLGSYNLSFAQGLSMNTGFRIYALPETGFRPLMQNKVSSNSSSNEEQGLRGIAFTLKPVEALNITLFYSAMSKDALVNKADSLIAFDDYFTSLTETGLHRTQTELAKKDVITMRTAGGNFQYRSGSFRFGGTLFNTDLSETMIPNSYAVGPFNFTGNRVLTYGLDGAYTNRWLTAFTEYSKGSVGGDAWIGGVRLQSSQDYGISVNYRRYSPDYNNFYSNSFATSACKNETGIYAGFFANISKKLSIVAGSDQFRRPWLSYRADFPAKGSEYLAQLTYTLNSSEMVKLTYKINRSLINSRDQISSPLTFKKENIKLDIRLHPFSAVILKNRIEIVRSDLSNKKKFGYLVYQDLTYAPEKQPLSINLRYTLFDTDSYDERIYSYESDVLYSYSVPSFFMQGSRYSIMLQYKFSNFVSIWLKYAATYYPGAVSIGSGLDEITGNRKSEVKLQLMLKL